VAVAAEDDYGISRLQLFRSLNDSRALPVDLPLETPPLAARRRPSTCRCRSTAGAGRRDQALCRVEDNDPAGPRALKAPSSSCKSSPTRLRAYAARTRRDGRSVVEVPTGPAPHGGAGRRNRGLRKKLEQQPADEPAAAELRDEIERLAQRLEDEAQAVRESAEHLLPYDLDKA